MSSSERLRARSLKSESTSRKLSRTLLSGRVSWDEIDIAQRTSFHVAMRSNPAEFSMLTGFIRNPPGSRFSCRDAKYPQLMLEPTELPVCSLMNKFIFPDYRTRLQTPT